MQKGVTWLKIFFGLNKAGADTPGMYMNEKPGSSTFETLLCEFYLVILLNLRDTG